jgi:hypothetical protein
LMILQPISQHKTFPRVAVHTYGKTHLGKPSTSSCSPAPWRISIRELRPMYVAPYRSISWTGLPG